MSTTDVRAVNDVSLVRGGVVITMDPEHGVVADGGVAVADGRIAAVGSFADLRQRHPDAAVIGSGTSLLTPGYVNAHQHLTGDRLIASCIPEAIDSQAAIFQWAVPVHGAHSGDDDELSASLAAAAALSNGITCTVEAGTVAHPLRVAAALRRAGVRARIGQWGWDVGDGPLVGPVDEVLDRQRDLLERLPRGGLIEAGVTLVGHDLMSDALVAGASALAVEHGAGLTFHMSPHDGDVLSYRHRTGRRPFAHLDALDALGPHVLVAHAVHVDDEEVEIIVRTGVAVAACPWAYLRLAQGVTVAGRYGDLWAAGVRIGVGCDSENAGDAVDVLRAATLFVGLVRDRAMDPRVLTADDALALATIVGAQAIGMADRIGSLTVGKQADIVVHDTSGLQWLPASTDPVRQLMWASDGRSVSDVLVAGAHVVRDGQVVSVDVDGLRREASARRDHFLRIREEG